MRGNAMLVRSRPVATAKTRSRPVNSTKFKSLRDVATLTPSELAVTVLLSPLVSHRLKHFVLGFADYNLLRFQPRQSPAEAADVLREEAGLLVFVCGCWLGRVVKVCGEFIETLALVGVVESSYVNHARRLSLGIFGLQHGSQHFGLVA